MRKKLFAALVVAVGVAFAGYNMVQSQNEKSTLSDLTLANVEALAGGESGSDCSTYCKKDNRYNCYITYPGDTEGISCYDHRKA